MRNYSFTLASGAVQTVSCPGTVVNMADCSLPLKLTINGANEQTVFAGKVVYALAQIKHLTFRNDNTVAVVFSFSVGDKASDYVPQGNDQSLAPTYMVSNLGIADNTAAAGGKPKCDPSGNLWITDAMGLLIPGKDNGHRRQSIIFTMVSGSPAGLRVRGPDGGTFMLIYSNNFMPIELETDADLKVSGNGGTAYVVIGQFFLTNG